MQVNSRKNAVVYARVSSKEQEKEGFSIPAQLDYLRKYAKRKGIEIVREFREAETAKVAGRKEFENMLNFVIENSDIDAILVEKTDRLYRNIKDWTKIDHESMGIEIHFAKENTVMSKSSSSNDKLMHGIKVLMAKNYSDNLSEEVRKGHAEKLKRGIWPGKAPVGYLNKLDDHTIIVDSKLAPVVKRAFEMAQTGNYSLSRLKKELYKMGLKGARSGKELAKSQMSRMLSNKFYYGEFDRGGQLYQGSHEAIISKELFLEVQGVMGFIQKPTLSKYDFVFRGPITCSHCGSKVTAEQKRKKSGKTYIYYHCTNGKKICKNVTYIREEDIQKQYVEAFSKIKLTKDIIKSTRDALLESHKQEKEFRENEVKLHTARYSKLDGFINQLYTDKLEGRIELSFWENKTAECKTEQEEIEKRIEALRHSNTAYMFEGIKLMEIANSASRLFPMMEKDEKRKLINLVLSNPTIQDATLRYSYKQPFKMFIDIEEVEKWRERRDSNSRPSP